jgi:uncharacterized protein (TIGR02145 family)
LLHIFFFLSVTSYGQERVHELYKTADYDVHHDRTVELNWAESITTLRTWQAQKNKDGSYTWKDYSKGSGGNNGTYHEVLAKKYLSSEITVSKNKISVYWEERWIRPSDFYTSAETNDPMKIGGMKPPTDPYSGHKKGTDTYKDVIIVGDKELVVNVQRKCTHQRIPLYRGTDFGMGYGIGVTTNSRGRTTATRDYFPDHLFKHQVRLSFSLDEMAKSVNMTKTDLIVYLIENSDKLGDLNINSYLECSGFIYCAYRAFALEQYKEQHARQVEKKRVERARQDSIRQAEEERIRREAEEARRKAENKYWERIGIEKKLSAERAAAEGIMLVDLGLSVRWANANIGAMNEKDDGLCFAWAETQPKNEFAKRNYKPRKKYKPDMALEPTDDAATQRWGIGWHIPTPEQWDELLQKCKITEVKSNGYWGYKVTGPNGNSIFLPFARGKMGGASSSAMKSVNKFFDGLLDDYVTVSNRMREREANYWSNKKANKKESIVLSITSASSSSNGQKVLSTDMIVYGLPIRAVME